MHGIQEFITSLQWSHGDTAISKIDNNLHCVKICLLCELEIGSVEMCFFVHFLFGSWFKSIGNSVSPLKDSLIYRLPIYRRIVYVMYTEKTKTQRQTWPGTFKRFRYHSTSRYLYIPISTNYETYKSIPTRHIRLFSEKWIG